MTESFLTPLRRAAARGALADIPTRVISELVQCRDHLDVLRLGIRLGLEAAAGAVGHHEQFEQLSPASVLTGQQPRAPRAS